MLRLAEVPGSCLFPLMPQTNAQTHSGPRLMPGPTEMSGTCLSPQRSQVYSSPDWQNSWLRPSFWEVLDSHPDPPGFWLRSTSLRVPDSHLDLQWSLALAHSLRGYSSAPVLVEIADSGSGCWLNPDPPVSWIWVDFQDWICSWLLFPVELLHFLS